MFSKCFSAQKDRHHVASNNIIDDIFGKAGLNSKKERQAGSVAPIETRPTATCLDTNLGLSSLTTGRVVPKP